MITPTLRQQSWERSARGEYPSVLIDDEYRECVCFLCVENEKRKVENATGFFVSVPLNEKSFVTYLVTARHVVGETQKPLWAKINLNNGRVRYQRVPQNNWICHPSTDVAAIPFHKKDGDRFMALWENMLANDQYLNQYPRVHPGDDIFFVGLFAQWAGENQAEPIIRRGSVALGMRQITLKTGKIDAYLVETKS